jgi:hypothetical protein
VWNISKLGSVQYPPAFGVVKLEILSTRKFDGSMKRKVVVDGANVHVR